MATENRVLFTVNRWWMIGISAVILISLVGYIAGYRFTAHGLQHLAPLTITNLPPDSGVFVDSKLVTASSSGTATINVLPGSHALLASADGYWPWSVINTIPEGGTTVAALLIPATLEENMLAGASASAAQKTLAAYTLPSAQKPYALESGCALVSVANNQIIATPTTTPTCTPPPYLCTGNACDPTIIFTPVETIHAVIPYPSRSDALIVSAGSHVYALALNPLTPRTFAPITLTPDVTSVAPVVITLPDGNVVGSDNGKTFSLTFPASPAGGP